MDSVGGMLDAFTSKEQVCFNAKVLDEHLPIAFGVIADLVLRPKFDPEDLKKERQVVFIPLLYKLQRSHRLPMQKVY